MAFDYAIQQIYDALSFNGTCTVLATLFVCIAVPILIGDGTPSYSRYPFLGDGMLKPWLKWSTADRWRLNKLEPVGYEKYSKNGIPWRVTFWGLNYLVMPPKYLRDLRTIDRHRLNLAVALSDALNMEASVGTVPIANTMEIEVVSKHLNAQLANAVPLLNDEADYVFAEELGHIGEWKQFAAMDLCSKLVHYISNRILVGAELCRRQDYRAATEALNMSQVIFGCLWNFLPLGPFRKPFYWITCIPYRLQIRRAVRKFLIPIIEERMAQKERAIVTEDEKPLDTIQLMVDMPPAAPNEVDSFRHAIRILHLHFASTGSSISLLHHTIWQLLQDPQCIEPIRAEIKDVRERFGARDGIDTLNHLHLLDSFIREVLRVHIPSALVSLRTVLKEPVTLHDGFRLERGARIVFPAQSIHFDPQNYHDPQKFIGFRFAGAGPCSCASAQPLQDSGRAKADAVDEKYLPFGYGKQACPGRFFALKVVKLILARLVYDYDIKWAHPPPSAPTDWNMEGFFLPAKNIDLLLRSRNK